MRKDQKHRAFLIYPTLKPPGYYGKWNLNENNPQGEEIASFLRNNGIPFPETMRYKNRTVAVFEKADHAAAFKMAFMADHPNLCRPVP